MNRRWLRAKAFHDVDFPTCRPPNSRKIIAQQPEGCPSSLSRRNLDPRVESPLCLEAPRGIAPLSSVSGSKFLLDRLDDEVPVFLANILAAGCIVFQLIIAPAISPTLNHPFGRVRCRTGGAIELVAPRQNPPRFRRR